MSSGVTGDGWKRLGCSLEELDLLDLDRENWYVRCDNYAATTAAINARAVLLGMTPKKILFDGDVSVASSQTLDAETTIAGHVEEVAVKGKVNSSGNLRFGPQVQRVYIGGRDFTNSYKNNSSLLVSGSVAMRATSLPVFADGSVTTVCPTTPVPGRAELVIFGDDSPNLSLTGTAALCNTTVYLAGDTGGGTFSAQQVTSGGTCSTDLPCPRTTGNIADAGTFLFQGGTVDWTAPNATSGEPPAVRGVEDLLFWSESSGTTDVKSGARMVTQGIFVGPNMNMEFRSPALGEPRNAQFIARQLELLQGTLYMRPAPNDSARIPAPGSFVLIR